MVCIVKCLCTADVEDVVCLRAFLFVSPLTLHRLPLYPPPPGTHTLPSSFFHPHWEPTPPNIRPHVRGTRGYIFLFQAGTPTSWALNSISHFKSSTKSNWNAIILFIIHHPNQLNVRLFTTIHMHSISFPVICELLFMSGSGALSLHCICLRCTGTHWDRHQPKSTQLGSSNFRDALIFFHSANAMKTGFLKRFSRYYTKQGES